MVKYILILACVLHVLQTQASVVIIEPNGDVKQCYIDSSGIMVCI